MRRFWVLLVLGTVLPAGCSQPVAPPPRQTVGDLTIALSDAAPPHIGDNMLSVTLAEAVTQRPVGNANLTATPEMLSPRGLGSNTSGRAQGNGLYTVPVRFGIATRYSLHLKIERPGKPTAEAAFPVEAVQ